MKKAALQFLGAFFHIACAFAIAFGIVAIAKWFDREWSVWNMAFCILASDHIIRIRKLEEKK